MSTAFDNSTIYLVDGDGEFLQGLSYVLRAAGMAVETYTSGEAFLSEFDAVRRGCVVVNVRLPGMSGIDLIGALAAQRKSLWVIAVGARSDDPLVSDAIDAGASIFVGKSFDATPLLGAIHRAMSVHGAETRLRAEAKDAAARLGALSARERDVLDCLAQGLTIKETAGSLALSPKSVETYRARLVEKLNAKSPASLMRIALLASLTERL